jgi:hypothetical protein
MTWRSVCAGPRYVRGIKNSLEEGLGRRRWGWPSAAAALGSGVLRGPAARRRRAPVLLRIVGLVGVLVAWRVLPGIALASTRSAPSALPPPTATAPVTVTLEASAQSVTAPQEIWLHAQVSGNWSASDTVNFQYAFPPYEDYRSLSSDGVPIEPGGSSSIGNSTIADVRYRAVVGNAVSNAVSVTVFQRILLTAAEESDCQPFPCRPNATHQPFHLTLGWDASLVPHHKPPRIYVYRQLGSTHRWIRFASRSAWAVRPRGNTPKIDDIEIPNAGQRYLACVSRPLSPRMGIPFTFRQCGGRTLTNPARAPRSAVGFESWGIPVRSTRERRVSWQLFRRPHTPEQTGP